MSKLIDTTALSSFWSKVTAYLMDRGKIKKTLLPQLVGMETETGGEVFNDYQNNVASTSGHAEGGSTTADGGFAHAEGLGTVASGGASHAEGAGATASGSGTHAEGYMTTASGEYAHAEGYSATASGNYSHAEGSGTASALRSHAEGNGKATADYSHAEGQGTESPNLVGAHVEGVFNAVIPNAIHTVGAGYGNVAALKVNAHVITKDCKHFIPGIGGYTGRQTDLADVKDLATVINEILERLDANE